MNNQFSDLWSINKKEALIGLVMVVVAALLDLVWSGLNPVIIQLKETQTFDISLFTTAVNIGTAVDTVITAGSAYIMVILGSGAKKPKNTKL